MKKMLSSVVAIAMIALCGTAEASVPDGGLININFGVSGSNMYTGLADVTWAAPLETAPQQNGSGNYTWNNVAENSSSSITNLLFSDATSSLVSVSWSGKVNNGQQTTMPGPAESLMKGQLLPDTVVPNTKKDKSGFITFTGLTSGSYRLYVYSQPQKNKDELLNLTLNEDGTSARTMTPANTLTAFSDGTNGNVTVFDLSTEYPPTSTQTLNFTSVVTTGQNSTSLGGISGVQLYRVSGPAPEPASMTLLVVGALIALACRLFRKSARSSAKIV